MNCVAHDGWFFKPSLGYRCEWVVFQRVFMGVMCISQFIRVRRIVVGASLCLVDFIEKFDKGNPSYILKFSYVVSLIKKSYTESHTPEMISA